MTLLMDIKIEGSTPGFGRNGNAKTFIGLCLFPSCPNVQTLHFLHPVALQEGNGRRQRSTLGAKLHRDGRHTTCQLLRLLHGDPIRLKSSPL